MNTLVASLPLSKILASPRVSRAKNYSCSCRRTLPFYELNPKIKTELKNVYYDLAACPLIYEPSLYRKLIEVVGPEKILWGTDYPLRIFPKGQKAGFFDLQEFRRKRSQIEQFRKGSNFW